MIASILSVLKTGAAYVPVEPSFPIERLRPELLQSQESKFVKQGAPLIEREFTMVSC